MLKNLVNLEMAMDIEEELVEEEYYLCDECGDEMEEVFYNDGYQNFCEDCYDEIFEMCEECLEATKHEELSEVYDYNLNRNIYICEGCLDSSYDIIYCQYHHRYEKPDYKYYIENFGEVCEEAYESGEFAYCEECNQYYEIDNIMTHEDYCYCLECYEQLGLGIIGQYHSSDFEFMTEDDEEQIGYGIELELEFDDNLLENAEYINDNYDHEIHLESDCSLDNGFECVTNPMSFEYFKNTFVNSIDNICENLEYDYNKQSDSNGMHIHISRQNDQQMYNLAKIMEYYKEEFVIISKRDRNKLNKWARFYDIKDNEEELENLLDREHNRYHALNVQNRKTLEIRIFKGTIDPLEIKARIELVHNMNQYALENEVHFDNMPEFMEIALYKENEYLSEYFEREEIDF